jgi:hypothetical protein
MGSTNMKVYMRENHHKRYERYFKKAKISKKNKKKVSRRKRENDNRGFAPMTPRVFSAGPSGLAVSFL